MGKKENQIFWDKVKGHPVYIIIGLIGSIASIMGLLYIFFPKNTNEFDSSPTGKKWNITKEYSREGEDIIEGWLITDSLTWGATIPLPPFRTPPIVVFWRADGSSIEKPQLVEKTEDQFTIKINSSSQTGEWRWRVRGLKKSNLNRSKLKEKNGTVHFRKNSIPPDEGKSVIKKDYSKMVSIKPSLGLSKDAKLKDLLKKILYQREINDWDQATLKAEFERAGNACTVEALILVNGIKKFHGEGIGLTMQSERPVPSITVMKYRALEHCLSKLLKTKDGSA